MVGLRERKRERTRQALIEAAARLFAERGYQQTTVAAIAAEAEIGTRTFFSYFSSKEEVLYPEADRRIQVGVDAIAGRKPGERPAEVLLRALNEATAISDELVGPMAALRLQLAPTVPAVGRQGLQEQQRAQRLLADALVEAFGEELDPVAAATLVGAFIGAIAAAVGALTAQPRSRSQDRQDLSRRLDEEVRRVLAPMLR